MHRNFTLYFLILLLFISPLYSYAQKEGIISPFRDIYLITGVPLDRPINKNTADVKFQLSLKIKPVYMKNDWKFYFAYTQITVWNFYAESSPFKDNSYMPGIYFEKQYPKGDNLILGIEHKSNGRPYFGNPVTDKTFDDYSRGANYFYASWLRSSKYSTYGIEAKLGFGAAVQGYPEKQSLFSLDLFVYYLGFVTFNYNYKKDRFFANASVTPIINESIANVTLGAAYRLFKKFPLSIYTQFHYGYDEALADCVCGKLPPVNLRIGLMLK